MPVCNRQGICVACQAADDCAAADAGSYCSDAGSCVACVSDSDCQRGGGGAGTHCLGGSCAVCQSDHDCESDPALPHCETNPYHPDLGRCVPCTASAPSCSDPRQRAWSETDSNDLALLYAPLVCDPVRDLCVGDCRQVCGSAAQCLDAGIQPCNGGSHGGCDYLTGLCRSQCFSGVDCATQGLGSACSDGKCVGCTEDRQCAAASGPYGSLPVCDLQRGSPSFQTCVQCFHQSDCDLGHGYACWPGGQLRDGTVLPRQCEYDCRADGGQLVCGYGAYGETTAFPLCDPGSGYCVQCLADGDCGPADGGTPWCDPRRHACVACRRDADCPGATALQGPQSTCYQGFCGGAVPWLPNARVQGCEDNADCPVGQVCGNLAGGADFIYTTPTFPNGYDSYVDRYCLCRDNSTCPATNPSCAVEAYSIPDGGTTGFIGTCQLNGG